MADNKSALNNKRHIDVEGVKFRPLKENEIRLLFGLWQLTYIAKNVQVTAEMICEETGLNENQFNIALRDLRQISRNCYVRSTRVHKLAVYNLIDERVISTNVTGRLILKLHSGSSELRIKFETVRDEVVNFFGTDEKVKERLNWLIKCSYLQAEENGVYVFCERFRSEIEWIKKIAEYSKTE